MPETDTKRQRTKRRTVAGLACAVVLMLTTLTFTQTAEAAHTWCGQTTLRQSSYTNWGITGFTHKSRATYCVNSRQIVDVGTRTNDIKRSSIGFFFLDSTSEREGHTPAANTWIDHHGRAGWDVTIRGIGFRIARGHDFDYDMWSTGFNSMRWSRSSSSWYLV